MTGRWHPPQSSGPSLGGGGLTAAPAPAAGLVRLAEGGAGAACSSRRFPLVDDDGGGNGDGGAGVGAFDGPAAEDRWLPDGVPFVVGAGAGTVGAGAGAGAVAGAGAPPSRFMNSLSGPSIIKRAKKNKKRNIFRRMADHLRRKFGKKAPGGPISGASWGAPSL